jgi:pimeloyl-ACP methyl ester carboxylesterase
MRANYCVAMMGLGFALLATCAEPHRTLAAEASAQWHSLPSTPQLPRPARSGFAAVNGIRLWYAEYGVQRRGVPVLLLHGGLASSNYFGHLIPVLVAHGYRVIAADSRGQGRSSRSAEPFGYHLMATDTLALLDQLHVAKVDLIGWSDGAIIGLDIAMTHADRLSRLFAFGANVDPSGVVDGADKNPVFAQYLRRTKDEYAILSQTPGQYDALSAQIDSMWSHEPHYGRDQVAKISTPVTIADGQFDEVIRTDHDIYMAGAIPGANTVFLPNVSHFAVLQNPAEFADAVLAFLKYR